MMLLDNTDGGVKKVYEWIEKYTDDGTFCAVTGYFTVGVLAYLSDKINEKIGAFQMVLGDISSAAKPDFRPLDLLSENIGIDDATRLSKCAQAAVDFLKQEKVCAKTLEPNFCHAKLYLHESNNDNRHNYFVMGSSNLTEAGIGLKSASNAELSLAETGDNNQYKELKAWFDNLWNNKALTNKTVNVNGKTKSVNFKQYLIDEISRIFEKYTPSDIYLKIVAELLREEFPKGEVEDTLRNSKIYGMLFDFQKNAAVSLVKMLENKNGAILADAVGLGKTFTTLAVIKYYQKQGRETVVLAPKKLQYNWEQYLRTNSSILEADNFDYLVKFHTDLNEDRLSGKMEYLTNEKPKLFVIDESHNLRNDKGSRYQFLLENILTKNADAKVLMLSATPINNSLIDIRNQFKLIGKFDNIDFQFKKAQEELEKWSRDENPVIGNLIKRLHSDFLELTDSLVLARTRKMVTNAEITFPKLAKPENIFNTPNCVEAVETFSDLTSLLPIRFSAYMPAYYADMTNKQVIYDEKQRSVFLVKMLHILLVKRLESSWVSFKLTLEKILEYHKHVSEILEKFGELEDNAEEFFEDEDAPEYEELTLGKRQKIKVGDIKDRDLYKKDLSEDIAKLQYLLGELEKFTPEKDTKIEELAKIITRKQKSGNNNGNQKVLIFTTYTDTAEYLLGELKKRFGKIEYVTGKSSNKEIDDILKRFSPISKNADERQAADPVDILIATDVLSEGQNLQDCDTVINYDIHWNPVRVIQRLGRIDRIGSRNENIYCVNFWPEKDINAYLQLQARIEKRMAAMTIAGTQIPQDFTDKLLHINKSSELEKRQNDKNLEMMQNKLDDIEPENLGMNNLSLENFRQDMIDDSMKKYRDMPNGIFSGFKADKSGLVGLLRHRKSGDMRLIFINDNGEEILPNQYEILRFLQDNKDMPRYVPQSIENCGAESAGKLSCAIKKWLRKTVEWENQKVEDDLASGIIPLGTIDGNTESVEDKFTPPKWDLICWEIISDES